MSMNYQPLEDVCVETSLRRADEPQGEKSWGEVCGDSTNTCDKYLTYYHDLIYAKASVDILPKLFSVDAQRCNRCNVYLHNQSASVCPTCRSSLSPANAVSSVPVDSYVPFSIGAEEARDVILRSIEKTLLPAGPGRAMTNSPGRIKVFQMYLPVTVFSGTVHVDGRSIVVYDGTWGKKTTRYEFHRTRFKNNLVLPLYSGSKAFERCVEHCTFFSGADLLERARPCDINFVKNELPVSSPISPSFPSESELSFAILNAIHGVIEKPLVRDIQSVMATNVRDFSSTSNIHRSDVSVKIVGLENTTFRLVYAPAHVIMYDNQVVAVVDGVTGKVKDWNDNIGSVLSFLGGVLVVVFCIFKLYLDCLTN